MNITTHATENSLGSYITTAVSITPPHTDTQPPSNILCWSSKGRTQEKTDPGKPTQPGTQLLTVECGTEVHRGTGRKEPEDKKLLRE